MVGLSESTSMSPGNSPPIRQPFYTDAYSPPLRPVIPPSYKTLLKMISLSEPTKGADGRLTSLGEMENPRNVVVVVDASKELSLTALQYAVQQIVRPGDHICFLGIVHQVLNPIGYTQKADVRSFGGISMGRLDQEARRTLAEFEDSIYDQELLKHFASKQITSDIKIATGPVRKEATAVFLRKLGATWVILDENLKKDRKYLKDHLNCNILLMKPNSAEPTIIKVQTPKPTNADPTGIKVENALVAILDYLRQLKSENGKKCSTKHSFDSTHATPTNFEVPNE